MNAIKRNSIEDNRGRPVVTDSVQTPLEGILREVIEVSQLATQVSNRVGEKIDKIVGCQPSVEGEKQVESVGGYFLIDVHQALKNIERKLCSISEEIDRI